jgi:hypothetical protein
MPHSGHPKSFWLGRSTDKKEGGVGGRPGDTQRARLQARVEPHEQHTVLAGVDDRFEVAFQERKLVRLKPAFMYRFLPARGVGAHDLQRAGEPARMADS